MTGRLRWIDSPRSPVRIWPRYCTNWIGMGWSSPYRAENAAQISSVARSPSAERQGSPGITRASTKTIATTPKRTGMLARRRRKM